MTGGSIIKQARRRAGLTQAQLAERLGTTQSAVARWESGRVSPTFETLTRIVRACGLDLVVFIEERDDHDLGLALRTKDLPAHKKLERLTTAVAFGRSLKELRV